MASSRRARKYRAEPRSADHGKLDRRLSEVLRAYRDKRTLKSVHTRALEGDTYVHVVAVVDDPKLQVPGLRAAGRIQTGLVPAADIEGVANHPNVRRLEVGRPVSPQLDRSLMEIGAAPAVPGGVGHTQGQGVIIGFVDVGCDFRHDNFRNADGSTRIRFLWDQGSRIGHGSGPPAGFGYGEEFTAADIDRGLAQGPQGQQRDDANLDPYVTLGYLPSRPQKSPSHGTHVMDIAAGNGRGTGRPGVAPRADIIFVQLDADRDAGDGTDESLASSAQLIDAVEYIFEKAGNTPVVVNMSLATHGGPHDGTTPAELRFDELLLEKPGRAIVVGAGNSRARRIHASGSVSGASPRVITWNVKSTSEVGNELEVWYPGGSELVLALTDPDGNVLGPFALPTDHDLLADGIRVAIVKNHAHPESNGDHHIDLVLLRDETGHRLLPAGAWRIELSTPSAGPVPFHLWIERTLKELTSDVDRGDADPSHTTSSIACGRQTIAVAAYDARENFKPIAEFSAEGPTRDGRDKPDISAPGVRVRAARSLTHAGDVTMQGTSMAAPHVTGVVALMMSAALPHTVLDAGQIRQMLLRAARRHPPDGAGWHARFGHGRVDAAAALREVQALQPAPGNGPR